jgi:LmbE family N-acetylglucosaminyl deacetylase
MVSFDAADPGMPEAAWRSAGTRERAAAFDIGAIRRLVVLAAHPDDETLVAGGLIHAVAASGRPVVLVVATLGERSHPHSRTMTAEDLGTVRETEIAAAAGALAPDAQVLLLRLPDGGLAGAAAGLDAALREVLAPGDTVVVPWRRDGHPDHEALAEAAVRCVDGLGASLLEAPIWAWHWGTPEDAWPRAVRFDLGDDDLAAKSRALLAHRSQTAPLSRGPGDEALLSPGVLEHFSGADELFFPSGTAAVDFDAMYAASDDPWGFADRWYERRKRALTIASLPAERYRSAIEIGCSIGLFTDELADRVDALVATDVADRAIELATARLAAKPWVRIEQRRLPAEWPDGSFDLVILSETGFYLSRVELLQLAERIAAALEPGGVVLLCHWRPHVAGLEVAGDEVHEILRDRLGFTATVRHVEDDFVLEVLQADPAASVAKATGLR